MTKPEQVLFDFLNHLRARADRDGKGSYMDAAMHDIEDEVTDYLNKIKEANTACLLEQKSPF